MIEKIKKKIFNKPKNVKMAIIVMLCVSLIGITFAFFAASISDSAITDLNVATEKSEALTFSKIDDSLSIHATMENFGENDGNLTDTASSSATLIASSAIGSANETYNVYLNVKSNTFLYTQNMDTPELILKVTGPSGELGQIEGLKPVTITDAVSGETITGFDVTTYEGLIKIKENQEISTTDSVNGTTQNWEIELIFVNLPYNQIDNTGKEFSADFILQKDIFADTNIIGEEMFSVVENGVTSFSGIDNMTYAYVDFTPIAIDKEESANWILDPNYGIYFLKYDVAADVISKNHSEVEVIVEYLDEGTGSFNIVYNSSTYQSDVTSNNIGNVFAENLLSGTDVNLNVSIKQNNQKQSEVVTLQNTGEWKSKTFILDETEFDNAMNGYDFAIANHITGKNYEYPQTLKIRSVVAKSTAENLDNSTEGSLTYQLVDLTNESVVHSGSTNVNLLTDAEQTFQISTNINKNSSYEVRFDMPGQTEEMESSLFSVMPLYTNSSTKNDFFGICTHYGFEWFNESIDTQSQVADNSNAKWIRDEIRWSEVEKVKGDIVIPAKHDNYINATIADGMEPLLIIAYGNKFYDGGGPPYSVEGLQAFENYVTAVATHFKGRVSHFEIWNEYNLPPFNITSRPTEDYVQLLEVAYNAIKAVIPDAIIIGGAMAVSNQQIPEAWFREILDAGAMNYMDAVSYHPYSTFPEYGLYYDSIATMNSIMAEYGTPLPIWITEIGWPVTEKQYSATELDAAEYLARTYILGSASGVERIFWYDLINDGTNSTEEEHNFGLVRNWDDYKTPLAAKLPYISLNSISNQLNNLEFVNFVSAPNSVTKENVISILFKDINTNEAVFVIWSVYYGGTIPLSIKSDSAEITDIYSNIQTVAAVDGKINIDISSSPIFIRAEF